MSTIREPVWIAFPKISWGSIGWRMGAGEDYWHSWVGWYKGLPEEMRALYKQSWVEPEGWGGFYEFMETGALPPWKLEQQRLVAEAAIPPQPEESAITSYYRVLWLIRQHMKRTDVDSRREDESVAEIYAAPDGSVWRLSSSRTRGGLNLVRVEK